MGRSLSSWKSLNMNITEGVRLDRRMMTRFYSQVVEYVDKVAKSKKSSFHQAAQQIFTAKVSGTFSRSVLTTLAFGILPPTTHKDQVACNHFDQFRGPEMSTKSSGTSCNHQQGWSLIFQRILQQLWSLFSKHHNAQMELRYFGSTTEARMRLCVEFRKLEMLVVMDRHAADPLFSSSTQCSLVSLLHRHGAL